MFKKLNKQTTKKKDFQAAWGSQAIDPGLRLKWNAYEVFTVENLYTIECQSYDDIMNLFHIGIKNKVVGSHKLNLSSSRSHTVFTITVESIDSEAPDNIILSKLQLVDLAGSERQSFTAATGKT